MTYICQRSTGRVFYHTGGAGVGELKATQAQIQEAVFSPKDFLVLSEE